MRTRIAIMTMLATVSGCAASFMAGSKPYQGGAPTTVKAAYVSPSCVDSTGKTISGAADQTYYLATAEGGAPALYELDAKGSGALITNHWTADDGEHFFTSIRTSHAFEYVFPREGAPVRLVYQAGTYRTDDVNGVLRPMASAPTFRCALQPKG